MENDLLNSKNNALSLILNADSLQELEETKIRLLGRNGEITKSLKMVAKVPPQDRPQLGRLANEVKAIIEDTIRQQEARIRKQESGEKRVQLDVTEPGIKPSLGHLHLVTQAIREITQIFEHIGFTRVRYPEIEWDWYAFSALNFPSTHPARDDLETFFIDQEPDPQKGPIILSPHTSSGQVREMEKGKLPIRMVNIAKTYRRQADVSHTQIFHQFETLVVGENISIANLKGTLDYFVKAWFGQNRKTRIRPYHFQFTEPSFETDVSCDVCSGKGKLANGEKCRLCKEGWLEIGGAGMVHANVLKAGGIDPKKYSGFASGWGVERVLMMRENIKIDDLRTLYANDLDFLKQF